MLARGEFTFLAQSVPSRLISVPPAKREELIFCYGEMSHGPAVLWWDGSNPGALQEAPTEPPCAMGNSGARSGSEVGVRMEYHHRGGSGPHRAVTQAGLSGEVSPVFFTGGHWAVRSKGP